MIKLNVTQEEYEKFKKQLVENMGTCVCSLEYNNPDMKCMCKEFKEAVSGVCHCGVFIKE